MVKEKWRIDALLGTGGMAAVYGATHRNGSRVALKMLHPTMSMDPALTAR
ncbi:MAG: serine/threonine protein kinase, partial [Myxococcales bacterium]|nr:serine/threonine protein kinase [Myxococcales bacterium]